MTLTELRYIVALPQAQNVLEQAGMIKALSDTLRQYPLGRPAAR